MTIIIPKRYLKKYETEPLYNDKEHLQTLKDNIRAGKVVVIDDEDYNKLRGLQ